MGKRKRGPPGGGGNMGGGNSYDDGNNMGDGYQGPQGPINPYKPFQFPLTPEQRGNLRQQVIFAVGDPSTAFGRNSPTPCTLQVTIRDPTISIEDVINEFTKDSNLIPHQDHVARLNTVNQSLVFGLTVRDALAVLQTTFAHLDMDPPIFISLLRYAGPNNPPDSLNPQQSQLLDLCVTGPDLTVLDLSLLPLQMPNELPWALDSEPYFSALVSCMLSPRFVRVTFLKLQQLAITSITALKPLENILQGLDLSFNQIANVTRDCTVLSTFTRLEEVNLLGNPCTHDSEYANKLNTINRMIRTIDGQTVTVLAIFHQLPPDILDTEIAPDQDPNDPIMIFLFKFLTAFDNERLVDDGKLSSAYQHDAAFSLQCMTRGVEHPDFAPISMRRNIPGVIRFLPPSLHNMETFALQDWLPLVPGKLMFVQFTIQCTWSAEHTITYKRTLILSNQPQKPWDFTILNDQIQAVCDLTEYGLIFERALLNAGVAAPGANAYMGVPGSNTGAPLRHHRSLIGVGSVRASSVNITRQWSANQNTNQNGFRSQNNRTRGNPQNQRNQQGNQGGNQQGNQGGNQQGNQGYGGGNGRRGGPGGGGNNNQRFNQGGNQGNQGGNQGGNQRNNSNNQRNNNNNNQGQGFNNQGGNRQNNQNNQNQGNQGGGGGGGGGRNPRNQGNQNTPNNRNQGGGGGNRGNGQNSGGGNQRQNNRR